MISPKLRVGIGSDARLAWDASFELGAVPAPPPGGFSLDPPCCWFEDACLGFVLVS